MLLVAPFYQKFLCPPHSLIWYKRAVAGKANLGEDVIPLRTSYLSVTTMPYKLSMHVQPLLWVICGILVDAAATSHNARSDHCTLC